MVLKAQIEGYDVGRVFMDVGSGINLIYARTMRAMNIFLEFLQPTDCSFYGIVQRGLITHWERLHSTFASAINTTFGEKSWNSK
jgi:hypothetical protein